MERYFAAPPSAPRADRGRSGVQHRDDRLPGDPHRSVVLPADRDADLSAHRQHRRQCRGRRVDQVVRRRTGRCATCRCSRRNWRRRRTLPEYLKRDERRRASPDIDTRKLTRILREKGAQNGCIMAGEIDETAALRAAREVSRARGHGPRQGGELRKPLSSGTRARWALGNGYRDGSSANVPRRRLRLRHQAQHPAHARRPRLHASPWCRRRRRPQKCWR